MAPELSCDAAHARLYAGGHSPHGGLDEHNARGAPAAPALPRSGCDTEPGALFSSPQRPTHIAADATSPGHHHHQAGRASYCDSGFAACRPPCDHGRGGGLCSMQQQANHRWRGDPVEIHEALAAVPLVASGPSGPPPSSCAARKAARARGAARCQHESWARLALVLLSLLPSAVLVPCAAIAADGEYGMSLLKVAHPDHEWDRQVEQLDTPKKATAVPFVPFVEVQSDDDMRRLYYENLDLDLAPWRGSNLSTRALLEFEKGLPPRNSRRVLMIKGGRVSFLQQPGGWVLECAKPCDPVMEQLLTDLRKWISDSPADWPDAVFVLNVGDVSLCTARAAFKGRGCPAPVLSMIKEWDRNRDDDILVPTTVGMSASPALYHFDWKRKIDRAVFRGLEYCHTRTYAYAKDTCSRTYFALKTQVSPDWSRYIDVGLNDNYVMHQRGAKAVNISGRGWLPLSELARFRYTLALDGITASSRLAKLLTVNSPVLKQTSPWIEWYYRSLVPGTHYISFWNHHRTDLLQAMKYVRHKSRYLQAVARHGQAFAYSYLSPTARRLYWRRALQQYTQLFTDMDEFIAAEVVPDRDPLAEAWAEEQKRQPRRTRRIKEADMVWDAVAEAAEAQRPEQRQPRRSTLQVKEADMVWDAVSEAAGP